LKEYLATENHKINILEK